MATDLELAAFLRTRPTLCRVLEQWARLLLASAPRPTVALGSVAWALLQAEMPKRAELEAAPRAVVELFGRLDGLHCDLLHVPELEADAVVPVPPELQEPYQPLAWFQGGRRG
jgi:hypothetical protein